MSKKIGFSFNLILVYMIILFNDNIIYLTSIDKMALMDTAIILVMILILFTKFNGFGIRKNTLSIPIIFLYMDLIVGLFISSQKGQQIMDGIKYNRYFIYYILYFPLSYLLRDAKNREKVEKFCIKLGILFSILALIQYKLYPEIIILKGMTFNYRENDIRYFYGFPCVIFSMFLILKKIFSKMAVKKRMIYLIFYFMEFWYVILVTRTKSLTIAILISTIIILLTQKKIKSVYKVIFIFLSIGVIGYLFGDSLIKVLYDSINDASGTGELRKIYWNFCLENIWKSPAFGWGVVSPNYPGVYYNIHVDIGMVGFIFEFGLLGLVWLLFVIGRMIVWTYRIYVKESTISYPYIAYISYVICISLFSCPFNAREFIISFLVLHLFLENDYKNINKNFEVNKG